MRRAAIVVTPISALLIVTGLFAIRHGDRIWWLVGAVILLWGAAGVLSAGLFPWDEWRRERS